jgi:two-component sensor histidine kinase
MLPATAAGPVAAGRALSLRAADALLCAAILLPVLLFLAIAAHDRARSLAAAEREVLARLDTLHAHAEKVLQFQALALGATAERLQGLSEQGIRILAPGLQAELAALRRHAGGEIGIVVFDTEGRAVLDAERPEPLRDISVRDRAYFRLHQDDPGDAPAVHVPVTSRVDGQRILFMTRRLAGPEGGFGGVVAAGIREPMLLDTWARAAPERAAAVTLFRRDGTILLRRPPLRRGEPQRFAAGGWVMQALAGPERQPVGGRSALDGSERIFAFRGIDRFPELAVGYGVSRDAVLAGWRRRLAVLGGFAAAAAAALALLAVLVRRRTIALDAEAAELERRVAERTAEIRAGEARLRFLAGEVDHRAKNLLAVVQATLRLTPRQDAVAYAAAVEGRVRALARAQTLLAEDRWRGAELRAVLVAELEPFLAPDRAAVRLDGPALWLPARAVQPLAMAAHELATNAVKHGALSVPQGRVVVGWTVDGATLRLGWREDGGPRLAGAPERRGFGSRVLDGLVRGQLGGRLMMHWRPAGLLCELEVPLQALGEPGAELRGAA